MSTQEVIRVGTRSSALAVAQGGLVADAVGASHPGVKVELVTFTTRGDRSPGSLGEIGGKGLFTAELESALRSGRIDLAVHSAKDLPVDLPEGLVIACVPPREDVRDALVSRGGGPIQLLPARATVGTGSLRRAAQLLAVRGDLEIVPIRGNVDTRLRKVLADPEPALDATVLAMAGLKRSGLLDAHRDCICPLGIEQCVPAAGQGALAVECAARDQRAVGLSERIGDDRSMQALLAERDVVRALGADCRSCLAVHVAPAGVAWRGWGMAARPDGGGMIRRVAEAATARGAAAALLEAMGRGGARELLRGQAAGDRPGTNVDIED